MNYETILLQRDGGVATVTLNRPERLNALKPPMFSEITSAMQALGRDDEVRAVIITGAGRAFCAGGDVRDLLSQLKTPMETLERSLEAARMVASIRNLPKPVIAAVHGPAVGAGCNLALACDIIMASDDATFGEVFATVGLSPDTGGTYLLPRLVGVARACELIFTGKIIDAREAERIGLVNRVVGHEILASAARELAVSLARGPSKAIGLAKMSIYQGLTMDMASALEAEARATSLCIGTEDAREGINALLEKRKPEFKGK